MGDIPNLVATCYVNIRLRRIRLKLFQGRVMLCKRKISILEPVKWLCSEKNGDKPPWHLCQKISLL